MKQTIILNHPPDFQEVAHSDLRVTYPIRYAHTTYWANATNRYAVQTFDGRYAYIYYYEFWIDTTTTVALTSLAPDLHLCYPLLSTGAQPITLHDPNAQLALHFQHERASYLYLPKTELTVELPIGHHIIIGITLDAGLFRPHLERHFEFVMPLVYAKRAADPVPLQSSDFKIGPLTRTEILNLFSQINPRNMENEYLLVHHQIYLITLSRLKIISETTKINTTIALVDQARAYLELAVNKFGAKALIKDIVKSLQVDHNQLARLHQEYYGCRLHAYRNQLLLERIIRQLEDYPQQIATLAEQLNFAGHSELNRFFKKLTGKSISQFKKS
ncbi:helix-turn-helix domain-containing protein [Sphingobacterium sp. UDSM-2020]|uniref:helix-turn-helix domain-containing protein n=1 Tax=Sphingobacterium sp. UDSM-2020 TaxID=2795738 RepID=UPI001936C6A7|nr:helix-turn-helix domain-containing protein [Sphingobacterium sp. UDSM-2020]QQD12370.1 AraC family transcriptional regulator [Sphingobacterium sp. UDSM-2020]